MQQTLWLQIGSHYAPELQQVDSVQWLKMLRCIFHHLVLLLLASKPSIITAETAWNDSPRPSHYCSLNSVSSVFCIIPYSQLSTLCGCKTKCELVMPLTSSDSLIVNDFSLSWSHCSEKNMLAEAKRLFVKDLSDKKSKSCTEMQCFYFVFATEYSKLH